VVLEKIGVIMNGWMIFIIVVSCVWLFILLLSVFLVPLRALDRILMLFIKCVIEILYIACLWWWIALIRLISKKPLPRVWLFKKIM
jgi:hypothetical protein